MKQILEQYKQFLIARSMSLNYYNMIRVFLSYLETKKIDYNNLSQEIITQFFNDNTYSIQSKNSFIKSGRNFSIFLGKETSEWHKVKLMKGERKIPQYLSEKELGEAKKYLITNHSKKYPPIKVEALLDFLFYSGVRKAELLGLKRSNFDLAENSAKVYGKGKKERIIYYPIKVKKNLENYFNSEPEKINAFNLTLGKINYIPRILRKYFKDRKITVHLFRHSGARTMIRKGIPLGVVSKILGHSNVTTTMIYTDPDEKMIEEMYKKKMK